MRFCRALPPLNCCDCPAARLMSPEGTMRVSGRWTMGIVDGKFVAIGLLPVKARGVAVGTQVPEILIAHILDGTEFATGIRAVVARRSVIAGVQAKVLEILRAQIRWRAIDRSQIRCGQGGAARAAEG